VAPDSASGRGRSWVLVLCRAIVLVVVALGACSDPLGPPTDLRPRLQRLGVDELAYDFGPGGYFVVNALPADLSVVLSDHERVAVEVTTSAGDAEVVRLFRSWCPHRERGWKHRCVGFSVIMEEGHTSGELVDHVAAIGGRMFLFPPTSQTGAIMTFEPGNNLALARRALSWPGVAHAEPLSAPNCGWGGGDRCEAELRATMEASVPVDTGAAVPGNGILEWRMGDTVTISYRQPGGGLLTVSGWVVELP
jgi:hypothetical protein